MTAAAWALAGALVGAGIVYVAMRARQAMEAKYLDALLDSANIAMQKVHTTLSDVMTLQQGIIAQQQKHAERQQEQIAALLLQNAEPSRPAGEDGKASE